MESRDTPGRRSLPNWSDIVATETHVHCLYDDREEGKTILALGAERAFRIDREDEKTLEGMQAFLDEVKGQWVFGVIGYDLKKSIERLSSERLDVMHFPVVALTVPRTVIRWDEAGAQVVWGEEDEIAQSALHALEQQTAAEEPPPPGLAMKPRWDEATYAQRWARVQRHLHRGDIYEMNLCTTWSGQGELAKPWNVFERLQRRTRAPLSAFIRIDECYAISGSPERFLKKEGNLLRSEPIKGTAPRSSDPREDEELAMALARDPKERAENIMICDLVRNDLSRVAQQGTVHVEELCGIHSFESVHQMISKVVCRVREEVSFTEILGATFPMGSMTGAPKIRSMQIIDELEANRRSWYAGAIGYIDPEGDFDFNVVIRTILHNAATQVTSFQVGGAITAASTAEGEYAECLLKGKAMLDALGSHGVD